MSDNKITINEYCIYRCQLGFHLPVALLVISLVLLVSTQFHRSIIATQQEIVSEQQQLTALRVAEIALAQGEMKIRQSTEIPLAIQTLLTFKGDGIAHMNNESVWHKELVDYDLQHTTELLTGNKLTWIDQPVQWWEKYTIKIAGDQTGFYAIEYIGQNSNGKALSDDQGKYELHDYRVTAKGLDHNSSNVVLQSIFTHQIYL